MNITMMDVAAAVFSILAGIGLAGSVFVAYLTSR